MAKEEITVKEPKRCRCFINASYNSKTAFKTGRLPKPCDVHDQDVIKNRVSKETI